MTRKLADIYAQNCKTRSDFSPQNTSKSFIDFRPPFSGRWKKADLKKLISFKTVVRSVTFDEDTEKFSVTTESLTEKKVMPTEVFDYVMVASGTILILREQKDWVGSWTRKWQFLIMFSIEIMVI